jgi:ferredoxin, 2Fe-2S
LLTKAELFTARFTGVAFPLCFSYVTFAIKGFKAQMAKITFIQHNGNEITADGVAGMTVMETAVKHQVPGIDADCGGACACATCHVYVEPDWVAKTGKRNPMEEDMLDFAFDVRDNSRLSCQIKVSDALDGLRVKVPEKQF